jgi:indolepyruvate ferredoxin oxidoreductase beta subunit
VDANRLVNRKGLNVALLGVLSCALPIAEEHWQAALRANFDLKLWPANEQAFRLGRNP